MSNYARISADDAYHMIIDNEVTIVDIRDEESYKSAGAYLAEKGFDKVFSLDGGFTEWAARFPDDCEPD